MKRGALLLVGAYAATACGAQNNAPSEPCSVVERRPVLFVHGSGLSSSSWNTMIDTFVERGYRPDWLKAVDLVPDDGANQRAAERFIAPAAERLLLNAREAARRTQCTPPARLDIVAHSMGAVSSRWYVARIAPEKVHTWIGIAPSNHGTEALCGHSGEGNREMCPGFAASGLQAQLNGTMREPRDETPYGTGADARVDSRVGPTDEKRVFYYTIRVYPDQWIVPANSALLDGAGGLRVPSLPNYVKETTAGNFLWQEAVGHDSLPADSALVEWVAILLAAEPAS